jgi:hypothetical protein
LAGGVINATSSGRLIFREHLLLQGGLAGAAPVLNKIRTNIIIEDGVAAFDHDGDAFPIRPPGAVQASGPIWGQGNNNRIVNMHSGTLFAYTGSGLPRALTTHGFEVVVGGAEKLYTELPFFNTANGAGIVSES